MGAIRYSYDRTYTLMTIKPVYKLSRASWTCVRDYKLTELLRVQHYEFKLTRPKQLNTTVIATKKSH